MTPAPAPAATRASDRVLERVVVPLNGTELSERALRPAAAVARRAGATLHLLSVAADVPAQASWAYLEQRAALAAGPVTVQVEQGDPAEVICRAAAGGASLVFMSCRGRQLGTLLSGHTAERVVATGRCPVAIVGPRCHVSLVEGERGRVVAAIDERADSEAVVDPAVALAAALDLELGFVEVVAPEETVEVDDVPAHDTATEEGERRLAAMVRRAHRQGVPATSEVLYGAEVPESLAHHANRVMASFLAMAVHPHRGVERLTSSGVALRTIARAPCPVLAVAAREPGDR